MYRCPWMERLVQAMAYFHSVAFIRESVATGQLVRNKHVDGPQHRQRLPTPSKPPYLAHGLLFIPGADFKLELRDAPIAHAYVTKVIAIPQHISVEMSGILAALNSTKTLVLYFQPGFMT